MAVMQQKISEYVSMNEQQRLVQAARLGNKVESPVHGNNSNGNDKDEESKDRTSSFEEISLNSGKHTTSSTDDNLDGR